MSALNLILNPTAMNMLGKHSGAFIQFCNNNSPSLMKLGVATGIASLVNSCLDALNGQATGNIKDFFIGATELNSEDFREDGGVETGSIAGNCGKLLKDAAIGAFGIAASAGSVFGSRIGLSVPVVQKIAKALMLWQSATVADEVIRGDKDGVIESSVDIAGGLASIGGLARLLA